jgi:hypothetical protein
LLPVSQRYPPAQSVEDRQLDRHAPNAGSQAYAPQSNAIAPSVGHAAPSAEQTAGPTPPLDEVQRDFAHCAPAPLPMQSCAGPQVPVHVAAAPQTPFRSTPTGSGVQVPADEGSAQL